MNPRTTGILLLVTLALGAFVYFYEIRGGEQRREAEERQKLLFGGIEEGDIASISLTTTDGADARLERKDGRWRLVAPLSFPADAFAADGLAGSLAGLASETVLEDAQPPEEYGLAEGARVVRFATDEGEHALRVGNETPVGSNVYATVEGSGEIVTVPRFEVRSFEKTLTDLRDRRILDVDAAAVHRIEVRWPGGAVVLDRAPEAGPAGSGEEEAGEEATPEVSGWRIVSPVEARADDEVVDRLLSDLTFLRADGFVDDPSEELLAGFEPPAFEVVLSGEAAEDAEAPSWRLAVGPVHDGDQRLVRGAYASLYTIPQERLADMPREVVAYRYKRLSSFDIGDAAQVDFFFHPRSGDPVAITAQRGPDGWTTSPEPMAPATVARLVSELSRLDADDILHEDATEAQLAEIGLSPPNTIVTVFGEAEPASGEGEPEGGAGAASLPRLAEIHIGDVQGSEWIIARAAGDPTVYRLGYELAEHLPVTLEAFRNRFLAEEQPEPESPPEEEAVDPGEFLTPEAESP